MALQEIDCLVVRGVFMIKVGDWVEVVNFNNDLNRTKGYIVELDDEFSEALFISVSHPKWGKVIGKQWFDLVFLSPINNKRETGDLKALIDWALDERDEETFKGLVELMES